MADKEETLEKLVELQRLMGAARMRRMDEQGPMADATRGRGRVLALLKLRDGVATKDMAEVLGIRVSSLNEVLSRLEGEGYVERRASESDGRVMLVYLTEKGKEAATGTNRMADVLFADFEDEEVETLDGYLGRMSASLVADLGDEWQERHEQMRHHRERMFAGDRPHHGPMGGPRGPMGGPGGPRGRHGAGGEDAHEGHRGMHGGRRGWGAHYGHEGHAHDHENYGHGEGEPASGETCDYNCRACTREHCVHGKF